MGTSNQDPNIPDIDPHLADSTSLQISIRPNPVPPKSICVPCAPIPGPEGPPFSENPFDSNYRYIADPDDPKYNTKDVHPVMLKFICSKSHAEFVRPSEQLDWLLKQRGLLTSFRTAAYLSGHADHSTGAIEFLAREAPDLLPRYHAFIQVARARGDWLDANPGRSSMEMHMTLLSEDERNELQVVLDQEVRDLFGRR